ncbi:Microspherule protein 1 [Linum perenne]
MAAPAAFSARLPWIPEDDLLLKNAVEAGASLEALAKGAVRFSRRFTVWELRDRWHSLLYDADVSAEASARMAELELSAANVLSLSSKLNKNGANKENGEYLGKRKQEMESVRRMYYAMKKKEKKRRKQHWSECSPDFSLLGAPKPDETDQNCDPKPVEFVGKEECKGMSMEIPSFKQDNQGADIVDGFVERQNSQIVEELKQAQTVPRVPLWGENEDTSLSELKVHGSVQDKSQGKEAQLAYHDDVNGNKSNVDIDISTSILESEIAISDSIFNFENEKELVCMDADRKDMVDISCIDNVDSVVSSCSNDKPDMEATSVSGSQDPVAKTGVAIASGVCLRESEVAAESWVSDRDDNHSMISADVKAPTSNSAPSTSSAESNFEEIICILNTEDPEVPCNNHIVLPKQRNSSMRQPSSLTGQKDGNVTDKRVVSSVKKDRNVKASLPASQRKGSNTCTVNDTVSSGVKYKSFDGKLQVPMYEQASIVTGGLNQTRLLQPCPSLTRVGVLKDEVESAPEISSPIGTLIAEGDPSTLDEKESESEDDDVPSFSEIESMILDMDLWPDDQDSYLDSEVILFVVLKYQSEDSKRVMMRLEQCAKSSTERAIASRGALALLYGRHLKHYIRDTQVILGRATDDMDVDIDLGIEGPANKISRRQAIIKMETDGSFILKNLGKSPMFMNGKELPSGQTASLISSSLIEIRDMAFIFEISSKSVGHFLSRKTR